MATDDFNRADEDPLDSPWVLLTGFANLELVGNLVQPTTTNSHNHAYYGDGTWDDDQTSEITLVNGDATDFGAGPGIRMNNTGGGNSYYMSSANGSLRVWKRVNGSQSQVANLALVTINSGDALRLEGTGTTLEIFHNDASQGSTSDADLTSGNPGISVKVASGDALTLGAMDDWIGTGDGGGGGSILLFVARDMANIADLQDMRG